MGRDPTIYFDEDVIERARAASVELGVPLSRLVSTAVAFYLDMRPRARTLLARVDRTVAPDHPDSIRSAWLSGESPSSIASRTGVPLKLVRGMLGPLYRDGEG